MAGKRLDRKRKDGKPGRVINAVGNEGSRADKITGSSDTALRLINDIRDHRIDPVDLTPSQRRSCLLLMANGTQTSTELAVVFKVSPSMIRMDLKKIRETLGREIKEWTLEQVLGDLALQSEKSTALAMKQEDPGLAWTIRRDFAKILKEFGVIGDRRDKNTLTMTIEGIGEGYERARVQLSRALDPRLTGEVLDLDRERDSLGRLPLSKTLGESEDEPIMITEREPEAEPETEKRDETTDSDLDDDDLSPKTGD